MGARLRTVLRTAGFLSFVVVVNVTTLLVLFRNSLRGNAAGPAPCIAGDVNGDGSVDISDPVALLGYIFQGAPVPVACASGNHLSQAEVTLLQDILPHLSVVYLDDGLGNGMKTVRFTGVNVQIVNGLGSTNGFPSQPTFGLLSGVAQTNGLGNLLVGYNAAAIPGVAPPEVTGSHNIIVGYYNECAGFGSLVVGFSNSVADGFSCVLGESNSADWGRSCVLGGQNNTTSAENAVVVGGNLNTAGGTESVICGGNENTTTGVHSVVSGGSHNSSQAGQSVVCGVDQNTASGQNSVVGGGAFRSTTGSSNWVAGGVPGPVTYAAYGKWVRATTHPRLPAPLALHVLLQRGRAVRFPALPELACGDALGNPWSGGVRLVGYSIPPGWGTSGWVPQIMYIQVNIPLHGHSAINSVHGADVLTYVNSQHACLDVPQLRTAGSTAHPTTGFISHRGSADWKDTHAVTKYSPSPLSRRPLPSRRSDPCGEPERNHDDDNQ